MNNTIIILYHFCEKAKIFKKIAKELRGNNNNGKILKNKDETIKLNKNNEIIDKNKDK